MPSPGEVESEAFGGPSGLEELGEVQLDHLKASLLQLLAERPGHPAVQDHTPVDHDGVAGESERIGRGDGHRVGDVGLYDLPPVAIKGSGIPEGRCGIKGTKARIEVVEALVNELQGQGPPPHNLREPLMHYGIPAESKAEEHSLAHR